MKKILGLFIFSCLAFGKDPFEQIYIDCPRAGKSAPAVSKAYIVRVISKQGGYENIQENQERIFQKHSTQGLKIVTAVCGYGGMQHDVLEYIGSPLKAISEKDIDSNGDGIVDGFLILWDMEGKTLGSTLHYKARSANSGNIKTTRLKLYSNS